MRKRNERIDVYFSEVELNVVKQKAKEAGLNCSELIRRAVLNKEVKQAPPADIPIMIRDIRRLGYNIDRLLKIADSTHLIDAPQMRKVLAQTWLMEQTIIDTFSKKGRNNGSHINLANQRQGLPDHLLCQKSGENS